MTAKIGGSTSPCTARQKISADRLSDSATITVGTASANIAATITRLRPSTSATVPVNGAVSATASVDTVMMVETCGGAGAEFAATAAAGSTAANRD